MISDKDYVVQYIIQLINNGFLSLAEELRTIFRLDEHGGYENTPQNIFEDQQAAGEDIENLMSRGKILTEWTNGETKKLLQLYELYLPQVGPMKKFKTKKVMWSHILTILSVLLLSNVKIDIRRL